MQFSFTKATKAKVKARVAIDGPSGAGKTYSALILATVLADGGKVAVIDTERGSASLYSDKFNFDVLELDTYSPAIYTQAITAAEKAGYSVIVIDSLSHAWEGEGGALDLVDQKSTQIKGNSYAAWKDVTPLHRRMVDKMLQSPAHVIVTMRSKMDYVQETDGNGKKVIRKVGMAPIQRAGMEYEFTLVADMDVDHHIAISKSRCDEMADKVAHKPGPDFWQKFSSWLADGVEKPAAPVSTPATTPAPQPKQQPTPAPKATATAEGDTFAGMLNPKMLVDAGLSKDIPSAAQVLNKLGCAGKSAAEFMPRVKLYRAWRDAGHDASAAAVAAIAGEQVPNIADAEYAADGLDPDDGQPFGAK